MDCSRATLTAKPPSSSRSVKAPDHTAIRNARAIIKQADEVFPDAIFAVHLDHGMKQPVMTVSKAVFYSSVMI